jgi:hypothetical protein
LLQPAIASICTGDDARIEMEKCMSDLSDEVKAELAKEVESKLMGFRVISLLKMMLDTPESKEDLHDHKTGSMK